MRTITNYTEKKVASEFNDIFTGYNILTPINNAVGGWPDRLVQLPNSRIIPVEIKLVSFGMHDTFRLATFRNDQAAWMANWQRYDGKCFLFIGLLEVTKVFAAYGIITMDDWRDWLKLASKTLNERNLDLFTSDARTMRTWFEGYVRETNARRIRAA